MSCPYFSKTVILKLYPKTFLKEGRKMLIFYVCRYVSIWWFDLPEEIFDVERFVKLSESASECRVKRLGDYVKLKLRTKRRLYTLKVEADKVDEVLRRVKCKVVELP